MAKTLSFADVRRRAPTIHVSIEANKGHDVTILRPSPYDAEHDRYRYSDHFIEGSGSEQKPYQYMGAAPVSPHFAIVDMWLEFRALVTKPDHRPIFIKVNDWLLLVGPNGVTADDGHFTKLLPDPCPRI